MAGWKLLLDETQKGAPNGLATLDANGKLVQDAKTLGGHGATDFFILASNTLDDISDGTTYKRVAGVNASHLITSSSIADAAVTGAKIADGAVSSAKIASGAVTNAKIADGAVSEAKIANGAVTNAKIANGAVTTAKMNIDADLNFNLHRAKNIRIEAGTSLPTIESGQESANDGRLFYKSDTKELYIYRA